MAAAAANTTPMPTMGATGDKWTYLAARASAPTQPLPGAPATQVVPDPTTQAVAANAANAPTQVNPSAQQPQQPSLGQRVNNSQQVRTLMRALRSTNRRAEAIPTPAGIAALIFVLVFFLFAIVPVNQGNTRLKLLWYVLTGNADLPGVNYGSASGNSTSGGSSGDVAGAGIAAGVAGAAGALGFINQPNGTPPNSNPPGGPGLETAGRGGTGSGPIPPVSPLARPAALGMPAGALPGVHQRLAGLAHSGNYFGG